MMRLSTNGTKRILEELKALGGRALALTANVTAPAQLQPAVERVEQTLGPVSILVNNAGIGAFEGVVERAPADSGLRDRDPL